MNVDETMSARQLKV